MGRHIAKLVSALKPQVIPIPNTVSMLHEPCDGSRSVSTRKHGTDMLHALTGMLPASCSLRMWWRRSAMMRCMATGKAISGPP